MVNEGRYSRMQQAIGLIVAVAVCFAVAGVGGLITTPRIPGWYAQLAKPTWTPPGWIFGPVWTLLYLMMAIAAWLIWRRAGLLGARVPLALFMIQLVFNGLWTILFFGLQNPRAAVIDILLLWAAIFATLVVFWKRSMPAGVLLLPYLLWVTFAAALNVAIWQMNR